MELIDSHCHFDLEAFAADRDQVWARCREQGVGQLVIPGIRRSSWPRLRQLCESQPAWYPALGLHPLFMAEHGPDDVAHLDQALRMPGVVAVGEIGLDYYDGVDPAQRPLLEAQLELARAHQLPVILHVRKAHDQVIQALRRIPVRGGIVHAFNGSLQQAQHYIKLGFCLGFGGMLTFERSRKLRRLAAALPLEALVLETDAPDMAPAAHQGERNSPAYLPEVLHALAALRSEPREQLIRQTRANVRRCLDLTSSPTGQ